MFLIMDVHLLSLSHQPGENEVYREKKKRGLLDIADPQATVFACS